MHDVKPLFRIWHDFDHVLVSNQSGEVMVLKITRLVITLTDSRYMKLVERYSLAVYNSVTHQRFSWNSKDGAIRPLVWDQTAVSGHSRDIHTHQKSRSLLRASSWYSMFPSQETTYAESKYVADILSSMASGEHVSQSVSYFLKIHIGKGVLLFFKSYFKFSIRYRLLDVWWV